MPPIERILETALYVQDLERAAAFYRDVLDLDVMLQGDRLVALDAVGGTVLLLFRAGGTREALHLPGGTIPAHDGSGSTHMAFAIPADAFSAWEDHLAAH